MATFHFKITSKSILLETSMESLRRLTSSVFSETGLVRRVSIGNFQPPDACSLELTFMTARLVVMGAPHDGVTDKKQNVVNVNDLAQYLDTSHRSHFMLFNLNLFEDAAGFKADGDNQSVVDKLHEQILEFYWERDGMKAHTPPLDLIFRICYALDAWLALDSENIALVNCQTGKTRSGVVVACYLLFARLADDPVDAFVEFYRKRWDMKSLTPQALRKKTPPSIQRFLAGFYGLLTTHKPQNDKPLLLKAIIFRQLPVELQPCVQIWDDYKLVFCTDALHVRESGEVPVLDWNEEDGFFAILWENGVELDGGFSVLCSFGEEYDNLDDVDASSRVLFRYVDSTLFLLPGLVTLKKRDLDLMKQYEHGFDDDQFSVDLVLHENSAKMPRSLVKMDFSGSSAVRQGLVEITKHHVVLPDPVMHSNFIRMGFCETSTTFALQCSQNAPNVALDLLHSKGVSACFVQEAMESTAKKDVEEPVEDNQTAESPTESDLQPLLRRQTTAEIFAMQSQRSRYSTPTALDSSLCDTCKEDDCMMRPQIVQCMGRCGKYYHTTCVGLRTIPFGLTTMSDCTNHAAYVEKFLSAWKCDACALKSPLSIVDLPGEESPSNLKLVPSSWVGGEPSTLSTNPEDVADIGNGRSLFETRDSLSVAIDRKPETTIGTNAPEVLNQLRKFLATNGLSIEDLMNGATSPGTTAASSANALASTTSSVTTRSGPSQLDMKAVLLSKLSTARKSSDLSERSAAKNVDSKYTLMLKRGVPFEAVQNCMQKDGGDPSTLKALPLSEGTTGDISSACKAPDSQKSKLKDMEMFSSYFRMLRMGCPKEAVKQKLSMDGFDPAVLDLGPDEDKDHIAIKQSVLKLQDDIKCIKPLTDGNAKCRSSEVLLKDREVYAKYLKMLKMGLSESALCQKMKADSVDVRALDLGGDVPFSQLPKTVETEDPITTVTDVKLKDDPKHAKYYKMLLMGLPEDAVRQKMKADGVNERVLDLAGDALVSQLGEPLGGNSVKLQDDPTYARFFRMLKMGLCEGAVRRKMKSEGIDERALDLGGDALVSALIASKKDVKLQDDPDYAKHFKMLKMGLPEGAVRQKMAMDNIDVRALKLGPDATVSLLDSANTKDAKGAAVKPKRIRKKLHWQAISEDRLSNVHQHTIWEDEDEDADFDVDMDELEALFFANQNTISGKKNSVRARSKLLKRRQTVTLINGKRAMNAAISLARVKLTYSEIAEAVAKFDPSGLTIEQVIGINEFLPTSEEAALVCGYTGDKEMLGEAEKFILEIAKVKRYGPRMECLVFKLSFSSRSAELVTSLSHLQNAGEEVKGSRLLKILLAMVLKLGNTLNGSGEEDGIKGFTVDSLLRLGNTKAVNQKTTVLHYLVRLVKKNHPHVLDFQAELQSVPLAARESFETIDKEFKKLGKELASLNTELGLLEKQAVETLGLEVTTKSMQSAAADIEAKMKTVGDMINQAREEISSVLDYFGEDPERNPTEFFTTLASFCTVFQRARNEVDNADEAAQRAERLKLHQSNTLRPPKLNSGTSLKVSRPILERTQTERHCDDNN